MFHLDYPTILSVTENLDYDSLENLQKADISDDMNRVTLRRQQQFLGYAASIVSCPETGISFITEDFHATNTKGEKRKVCKSKVLNAVELPRSFDITESLSPIPREISDLCHSVAEVDNLLSTKLDLQRLTLRNVTSLVDFRDSIERLRPVELLLIDIIDDEMAHTVAKILKNGSVKRLIIDDCSIGPKMVDTIVDFTRCTPDWEVIDIKQKYVDEEEAMEIRRIPREMMKLWGERTELPDHIQVLILPMEDNLIVIEEHTVHKHPTLESASCEVTCNNYDREVIVVFCK